jgi:hypothetical protein
MALVMPTPFLMTLSALNSVTLSFASDPLECPLTLRFNSRRADKPCPHHPAKHVDKFQESRDRWLNQVRLRGR